MQISHESKIIHYTWLKIELNASKMENKYKKFRIRNYSEFKIN